MILRLALQFSREYILARYFWLHAIFTYNVIIAINDFEKEKHKFSNLHYCDNRRDHFMEPEYVSYERNVSRVIFILSTSIKLMPQVEKALTNDRTLDILLSLAFAVNTIIRLQYGDGIIILIHLRKRRSDSIYFVASLAMEDSEIGRSNVVQLKKMQQIPTNDHDFSHSNFRFGF